MAKPTQSKGVRIIAGQWLGRRLPVVDLPGLRPSGERLREALFSWLHSELRGACCLDLFAGSGALGFEAASRGASEVLMLENNSQAVAQLEENMRKLKATTISLQQVDTLAWLEQQHSQQFDVVFLDPPFAMNWQQIVMEKLLSGGLLAAGALLYVESSVNELAPPAIAGLREIKSKQVGQVRMQLFAE